MAAGLKMLFARLLSSCARSLRSPSRQGSYSCLSLLQCGSRVFGIERALLGDVRQVVADRRRYPTPSTPSSGKDDRNRRRSSAPATRIMLAPPPLSTARTLLSPTISST